MTDFLLEKKVDFRISININKLFFMKNFFYILFIVILLFYCNLTNFADGTKGLSSHEQSTNLQILINSKKNNLDERLVKAITQTEIINKHLYKYQKLHIAYESHLRKSAWYTNAIKNSPYKGQKIAYCSYGKMQVLYGVAYSMGFRGHPYELNNDKVCFYYGCLLLRDFKKKYRRRTDFISAYNQGRPRRLSNGKYRNQRYVDTVFREYKKLCGNHFI